VHTFSEKIVASWKNGQSDMIFCWKNGQCGTPLYRKNGQTLAKTSEQAGSVTYYPVYLIMFLEKDVMSENLIYKPDFSALS